MTVAETIAEGVERLRACGVAEERAAARILLGRVLGLDRAQLLIRSKEPISKPHHLEYISLIDRRASGEPLQYITGHQEFYGLDFIVTPDVLIPRPETEFLTERIINLAAGIEAPLIVDVGTGSGCIAVTVAKHVPAARLMAIDISAAALGVAHQNAKRYDVTDRIEFLEGDLLAPISNRVCNLGVDIIASNPPYVPESKVDAVQREVREWEPRVALFGGPEGLDFFGRLLEDSPAALKLGGYLVCEIGFSQLDAVRAMIDPGVWLSHDLICDLQGIPRILTLQRGHEPPISTG